MTQPPALPLPGNAAPDAVCLMGPTCSGKTALALELAARFPIEIISVDSALVYRGMDIGTSKPSSTERAAVPHHLIDICDPRDAYSAGRFLRDAVQLVGEIRARGHVPLLVGGTMLYFRALTRGLAPLPEASPEVRASLEERAKSAGWPALHAELLHVDPVAGGRIRCNDAQRIQRALEVHQLTGQRISDLQKLAEPAPLRLARFALLPLARTELYARIEQRFDAMLAAGFVDEVSALRDRGDLHGDLPSLRAVGYRQLWDYLQGKLEFGEAVSAAKQATRNLAKRQLTWLRADSAISWINRLEIAELVPISDALNSSCGKMG